MSDTNYKKVVWGLILTHGGTNGLVENHEQVPFGRQHYLDSMIEFYGSGLKLPVDENLKLYEAIVEHGIDIEKTTDPAERRDEMFAGTFADEPDYYEYLAGVLVLNDGSEWKCGAGKDDIGMSGGFADLLKILININVETALENGIEAFGSRVTHPQAEGYRNLAYVPANLPR